MNALHWAALHGKYVLLQPLILINIIFYPLSCSCFLVCLFTLYISPRIASFLKANDGWDINSIGSSGNTSSLFLLPSSFFLLPSSFSFTFIPSFYSLHCFFVSLSSSLERTPLHCLAEGEGDNCGSMDDRIQLAEMFISDPDIKVYHHSPSLPSLSFTPSSSFPSSFPLPLPLSSLTNTFQSTT